MNNQIQPLQEYLANIVVPEKRAAVEINPEHITMLQGTKSKKQLSRKKRTSKSSTLTRREYTQLGLHTLPTRQMKYEEALPLHRLWKGYMKEHLGLSNGDLVPQVFDPRYDAFSKLLVKTDLHGSKMSVIQSKCPTLVGISGIVVMDTKNVLKILGKDDRLRTVPKSECVFSMKLGNMDFTIFGKHLCIRPAESSEQLDNGSSKKMGLRKFYFSRGLSYFDILLEGDGDVFKSVCCKKDRKLLF